MWETEEYLNANFRGFLFDQGGRSERRASQPPAARRSPSACHGSTPPTPFCLSTGKAATTMASRASACSPNPHGSPPPRPPDRPEAPDARRPRPIAAEDHPELCLLCPMASPANGRLARALAAPGLIFSPPEPRLDPPRHPGPIKGTPSPAMPPLATARTCATTFSSAPRFLLCAAAELPWSSPLCATPHCGDSPRFFQPTSRPLLRAVLELAGVRKKHRCHRSTVEAPPPPDPFFLPSRPTLPSFADPFSASPEGRTSFTRHRKKTPPRSCTPSKESPNQSKTPRTHKLFLKASPSA
uniref:Uncharacterized protein n=1 Tax=Setaria viridis TaxID=4556 RepID=A0A4U6VUL5_SETVI|nr:hypothetical protein SEVIR_2G246400v2 [Setaria viridis]